VLDLVLRGGLVVTPADALIADVGIEDGKIAVVALAGSLPTESVRVVEAAGTIVLPGGIEPHAHIAIPVPEYWAGRPEVMSQPPEAASRAAAFGGVTTVIDFAGDLLLPPGVTRTDPSILASLDSRRSVFRGHTYTDYAFHYILAGPVGPPTIGQLGEAIQEGVSSFKIFTTFDDLRVPYGHLGAIFDEVARHGGIMAVHAEDDDIVTYMTDKLVREGRDRASNLHLVHSSLSEDLAFRHVIGLARHSEVGIYFVHTTAREGVVAIAEARARNQPVYGEALHNYLEFTCEDYAKPGGTAVHTYPALKYPEDREALLAGLLHGDLCTTATDDYTVHKDVKLWGTTIRTVCGGHNGIETRLPVAFTKFVVERGMSLPRFAAITSTNAARILGLYPQKGAVLPGSDADLVLIDPRLTRTLTLADLHSDADYSIWEGFTCRGYPVMTILRGKVIVENGALLGSPSDGRWVRRKIGADILGRPAV